MFKVLELLRTGRDACFVFQDERRRARARHPEDMAATRVGLKGHDESCTEGAGGTQHQSPVPGGE